MEQETVKDDLELSVVHGKGSQASSSSVSIVNKRTGFFSRTKAGLSSAASKLVSMARGKKKTLDTSSSVEVMPIREEPKTKRDIADDIVRRWTNEDITEDSALLRVISDPLAQNQESDLRAEDQRLQKESEKLKEELDTVTSVLEEMEKIDSDVYAKEEEQKKLWNAEHEASLRNSFEKISEQEAKIQTCERELQVHRKEVARLARELEQAQLKAQNVEASLNEAEKTVQTLRNEMVSGQQAHLERVENFEKVTNARREADFDTLIKYKKAKTQLLDAIEERKTVKNVLQHEKESVSEKHISQQQEAVSASKSDSNIVHQATSGEMIFASKEETSDDLKKKMAAAVVEIEALGDIKIVPNESALTEIRGYICAKNPIRQSRTFKVYPARIEKKRICVKEIYLTTCGKAVEKHLWTNGLKILRYLAINPHPNITEVYALFAIKGEKVIIFEQRLKLDLRTYVKERGPLTEEKTKHFAYAVANAIQYLHSIGVAHQNICPGNVYMDENKEIRLDSLEYSVICWNVEKGKMRMQKAFKQRAYDKFLAPEIAEGKQYDPTFADIFSYGILIVYMLVGRYLYDTALNMPEEEQRLAAKDIVEKKLSRAGRDLVYRCLQIKPEDRISVGRIVVDPWFANSVEAQNSQSVKVASAASAVAQS